MYSKTQNKKGADRLHQSIEEQRARYQLSKAELNSLITSERMESPRFLFGVSIQRLDDPNGINSDEVSYRFPDELTALRAYVRAELGLGNTSSPLAHLAKHADTVGQGSRTGNRAEPSVRVRGKRVRYDPGTAKSDFLCDAVDVGSRLEKLDPEVLDLLLSYYVLKRPAKQLAKEYKVDVARLGGRISAARRALQRVLDGLVPPPRKSRNASSNRQPQPLDEETLLLQRREKVARMLIKRRDGYDKREAC